MCSMYKGRSYIQYVALIARKNRSIMKVNVFNVQGKELYSICGIDSWLIVPSNICYRSKLITNSMTHWDLVLPSIISTRLHKVL